MESYPQRLFQILRQWRKLNDRFTGNIESLNTSLDRFSLINDQQTYTQLNTLQPIVKPSLECAFLELVSSKFSHCKTDLDELTCLMDGLSVVQNSATSDFYKHLTSNHLVSKNSFILQLVQEVYAVSLSFSNKITSIDSTDVSSVSDLKVFAKSVKSCLLSHSDVMLIGSLMSRCKAFLNLFQS
ncbi:hypothetical protein P9112_012285 [Eukaryota sp. TZLM1-RC]